ncbi:MAG: hypothetical protein II949_07645 [Prevotella sp.]|nr:hypothetical protein [Prevotella sp.]
MKKIYLQPTTTQVKVETLGMIAASDPKPVFNPSEETTVMESRQSHSSVWDDEEE